MKKLKSLYILFDRIKRNFMEKPILFIILLILTTLILAHFGFDFTGTAKICVVMDKPLSLLTAGSSTKQENNKRKKGQRRAIKQRQKNK